MHPHIIPLIFLVLFLPQTPAHTQNFDNSHDEIIRRFEIRTGSLRHGLYTDIQPINREYAGEFTRALDTIDVVHSDADRFNLEYLRSANLPWSGGELHDNESPFLNYFYRSRANLYQVNEEGLDLFINPGFYFEAGYSSGDEDLLWINTRAAEIRGMVNDRVGFYSFISENQARPAAHERDFFDSTRSYPGAHFTKQFGDDGVDYFLARGHITYSPVPAISLKFGHDRNFIGNGYRSLLLSDFAPEYLFLKANTQIWRFNYQNIFARMTDRYGHMQGLDDSRPYPAKYAVIHYLSFDVLDNLNIGLFESVTFHDNTGSGRGFEPNYMNPIIFYRAIEHKIGDPDKMKLGLNLRYLPVSDIQVYGQFALHEFRLDDLLEGEGHIHNKYGYQAGVEYVDVAGVSNMDIGLEYNAVRPYSYAHKTMSGDYAVNSYTHYNHPLAHPLGANFREWIVSLEAQPFSRITSGVRFISASYGADSSGSNWGQNIFLDYNTYERTHGNYIGQGVSTNLNIVNAWVAYQLRHNLFIELNGRYRNLSSEISERNRDDLYVSLALRLNMGRRNWDF